MKITTIIVAYHPDMELLRRNIEAIHDHVDKILIWRNSADDLSALTSLFPKIEMIGDGTNHFMAYPLNQALQWAHNHAYDWLLTMDQDSVWDNFGEFLIDALTDADDSVMLYTPNVNHAFDSTPTHTDVETAITSGSLINVERALGIGGFKEKYEIYWVDGEFCYRARREGMKVRMLPRHNLTQQFGRQTRTLFGFQTSNYSPQIYYYLIRNMLWEHREHGSRAVSFRCIAHTLLFTTRGIILGEKQKMKKLGKISLAIWHGLTKSYR